MNRQHKDKVTVGNGNDKYSVNGGIQVVSAF